MDATAQAIVAALAGALVTGTALLAWRLSERQQEAAPAAEPLLPAGVASVLSVLRSSAIVVDEHDHVVKASAPTYVFGLVRGQDIASPILLDLAREVRSEGQIRQAEFAVPAPHHRTRHLSARVAPLSSRLILILIDDRTREHRLEAVRRDFVANVSHELKTPVGAIRLLADAVCDAADDPEAVTRFGSRMLTESDRLTNLVQQIIELSRLQDDDPLAAPEPVDVDAVVTTALDTSMIDAQAKGITLRQRGSTGLEVAGSREQITAAVSNLVANAVAYSGDQSTVVVNRKLRAHEVEISVIDRGIGIPAAEMDRIFERFYRVDPARHRSTGGTGLGLAIVKHVAATHGGDVRVWSEEGVGSTFTLTLPRSRRNESEIA